MDFDQTEKLIEKYVAGTATEEEELQLRQQFQSGKVPDHLKEMVGWFTWTEAQGKDAPLGEAFDAKLMAKLEKSENPARIEPLWTVAGVAAAVLLAVSLVFVWLRPEPLPPLAEDTYSDPKEAFEATKKALMMLSERFNEGETQVQKLETFEEVKEEVEVN